MSFEDVYIYLFFQISTLALVLSVLVVLVVALVVRYWFAVVNRGRIQGLLEIVNFTLLLACALTLLVLVFPWLTPNEGFREMIADRLDLVANFVYLSMYLIRMRHFIIKTRPRAPVLRQWVFLWILTGLSVLDFAVSLLRCLTDGGVVKGLYWVVVVNKAVALLVDALVLHILVWVPDFLARVITQRRGVEGDIVNDPSFSAVWDGSPGTSMPDSNGDSERAASSMTEGSVHRE
ncbi:hypothetical protein KIPB_012033, partial [Kipferlia bialata]|eukprot:g12033.t1